MPYLFILYLFFSMSSQAETFHAPLIHTKWQVIDTPLECTLGQDIVEFGHAKFSHKAGGDFYLSFSTHSYPSLQSEVNFEIAQALWQNSDDRLYLTSIPAQNDQKVFTLKGQLAKDALTHMQEGRFPAIRYHSLASDEEISALLSTVHLKDSMPAFQQCLANLHSDGFDSLRKLTVYFESEKASLSPSNKRALTRIANYLKIDASIKQIRIRGYTDNHGKKRLNIPLSEARAIVIKNYLMENGGVEESLITTSFHREYSPVTSNKTKSGRAHNRRAEIELIR